MGGYEQCASENQQRGAKRIALPVGLHPTA